jgi:hypothetical protein
MSKWTSKKLYTRLGSFTVLTILLSVVFGSIYYAMHSAKIDDFGIGEEDDKDLFNFWYFSWITQTTVGYGDYSPKSNWGKLLVCLQIFLFWVWVLVFAALVDEKNMMCILNPWDKC